MKKFIALILVALICLSFTVTAFAEESEKETSSVFETNTETESETETETDKNLINSISQAINANEDIAGTLDAILAELNAYYQGAEGWDAVYLFYVRYRAAIITVVSVIVFIIGAAVYVKIHKRSDRLAYKNLQTVSAISNTVNDSLNATAENYAKLEDKVNESMIATKRQTNATERSVRDQKKALELMAEALEDVIKLSGADEAKKSIYLSNIEKAKKAVSENEDPKTANASK